ncbi:hypothetical protein C8Q79DRAFT_499200 [Trametes meyenii]|nr:hypothetical protein C8Q79DRAFT_499200 [Trametes meyenii]
MKAPCQFVDPRKDPLIHRLSVQFNPAVGDHTPMANRSKKDPKPISDWKPDAQEVPYVRQRCPLAITAPVERLVMIPLIFTTAGRTGQSARATGSVQRCKAVASTTAQTPLMQLDPSRTEIPPAPFSALSPKRPALPSAINSRPDSAVLEADSSDFSGDVLTSPSLPERSALPAETLPYQAASATKEWSVLPVCALPASGPSTDLDSSVAPHLLRAAYNNPLETTCPTADSECSHTAMPSVAEKPLKSLVLFMNDFREIARSATAKSLVNGRLLGMRPRPRASKAPSTRTNGDRTPPPSLLARRLSHRPGASPYFEASALLRRPQSGAMSSGGDLPTRTHSRAPYVDEGHYDHPACSVYGRTRRPFDFLSKASRFQNALQHSL